MLTPSASRARDWAAFAAVALAPALLVALLGLRALRNEESAATREVARALEATGERAGRAVDRAVAQATERASAARLEGDDARVAASLAELAPRVAEPVVLSDAHSLLWPPPADPGVARPTGMARKDCSELLNHLASAQGPEERKALRSNILAACEEVQTDTGRWIWPLAALDAREATEDADRIAVWIERHAGMLAPAEREATRGELGALSMPAAARERAMKALDAPSSRRQLLVAELTSEGPAAALRRRPDAAGLVTWRAGASIGVLRMLRDGRLAGFVVDRATVAEAVAAGWFDVDPAQRIEVVSSTGTAEGRAEAKAPIAFVPLAPALALRIVPRDPQAVQRSESRSRALLAAMAIGATLAAFGVAAGLFARMRAASRSSELRTDFVSAVSHELRTPIASVRMLAELLEQDRVDEAERAEVYEAIATESRRLGETVDRLLGFSRMEARRYALARERVRVGEVVCESVATFELRHPDVQPVTREIDADVEASVDLAQVRLAVDNLLENARKYAPEGAPYIVRVAREAAGVRIEVEDRGPGIAKRDHRRIFRPFERVDDRLSRATEGSGIGLSLVHHVAHAHGGRVVLDSDVGRGARFTIHLP